jgi:hypothetical protein
MMSAIRAQLPTSWQYNLKIYKSQDILDRQFQIYPETRPGSKTANAPTAARYIGNRTF